MLMDVKIKAVDDDTIRITTTYQCCGRVDVETLTCAEVEQRMRELIHMQRDMTNDLFSAVFHGSQN